MPTCARWTSCCCNDRWLRPGVAARGCGPGVRPGRAARACGPGGVSVDLRRSRPCQYGARKAGRSTLPVGLRGSSATTSTVLGTLKPAMRSRAQAITLMSENPGLPGTTNCPLAARALGQGSGFGCLPELGENASLGTDWGAPAAIGSVPANAAAG